ncbi:MAG: MFS transporter [Rhodospirillaceae bacterium]|nr:MFS transporter [Rhodospirillaceae bacterium]
MTPTTETQCRSPLEIRIAAAGWLFCAIFFFYAFILRVAPAVMVDDLMREFAVGAAIVGNLSAVYLYIYAGLQIPVGLFIDRYGLNYLIAGACAVTGLGAVVFAFAETVSMAYLGRFLIGAGAAFSFVGALNMAARWFPNRFAVLGGWAQMLGSAGGFAGQAPLGLAIATFGWRSTNIGLGVAGLILAVLLLVTVRNPVQVRRANSVSTWSGLKIVASNKQTWLASIGAGGLTGTLLAFGGLWGVPFMMTARGLTKPEAAGLVSVCFIGWAVAAPLLGWISDRIGKRRPLVILGTSIATITTAVLILWPEMPKLALVVVLAAQGGFSASMILCFAVAKESNGPELSGASLGLINTFAVGGGAVLQPLVGLVLDSRWDGSMVDGARVYGLDDYRTGLFILPICCAVSLSAAILMKEPKRNDNNA